MDSHKLVEHHAVFPAGIVFYNGKGTFIGKTSIIQNHMIRQRIGKFQKLYRAVVGGSRTFKITSVCEKIKRNSLTILMSYFKRICNHALTKQIHFEIHSR